MLVCLLSWKQRPSRVGWRIPALRSAALRASSRGQNGCLDLYLLHQPVYEHTHTHTLLCAASCSLVALTLTVLQENRPSARQGRRRTLWCLGSSRNLPEGPSSSGILQFSSALDLNICFVIPGQGLRSAAGGPDYKQGSARPSQSSSSVLVVAR